MLDVFKKDAFSVLSMTAAIEKVPYSPGWIGDMGLFQQKGITTTQVAVEEKQGKLSLLQTQARTSMPTVNSTGTRKIKSFPVPHIPANDTVMADEVQNIRSFGTEDSVEAVAEKVAEKLSNLKSFHEATFEWHRVNAIQGVLKDADGSTIFNYFTEFGITETNINFDFTLGAGMVQTDLALEVIKAMQDALGGETFREIVAICGDTFFKHLIEHETVRGAYEKWQQGTSGTPFTIQDPNKLRLGFPFGGITWMNYRGKVGATDYVPATVARFVPLGTRNIFMHYMAPANFIEAVNTTGKLIYAKQEEMKFGLGVEIHTQSNPLIICQRPSVLIKATDTTP